jgi:nucleotide-binding universal stress UspA family protein
MKILLAVDGSTHSLEAAKCLVEHVARYRRKPQVELVYVHLPVPKLPGMGSVVGRSQIRRYYEEEGAQALAAAKKLLDAARIAYAAHVLVGQPAESIVSHAQAARCDLICIGNRGMSAAGNLLLGSVATRVLHIAKVPVLLAR